MKLKNVAVSTVALAIALTLTGCGPDSPNDMREKLEAAGAKDCDVPEPADGDGWMAAVFGCDLGDLGLPTVYFTVFEDEEFVEPYIIDQNSHLRDPYVIGGNWIAYNGTSGSTADPTKFIKDTLGGEIRPGEQKPFTN
ncbi:hypothetical protein [Brevibacterium linens]|uniref:Lipoprotein n=1 Tax=Brevibacterium linens TaxID=1703 RepID=A0A2H1IKU9_BRELN|nr:hypothetical protein [Brevibacterium linens]SMX75839.1 hypothetical protein BLIN101_01310 [Brevibacterium linens]